MAYFAHKWIKDDVRMAGLASFWAVNRRDNVFFFCMAYLNAWLMSFVGCTLLCSLQGWTTRGRHHSPVSVCLTGWPLHRISPCSFARSEVGSFTCIGCDSPIHGTDGLKSPPKDLAMRIKRLAKGRYFRGGIWTHGEPPVWKFAVYRLALRPLSHDRGETMWRMWSMRKAQSSPHSRRAIRVPNVSAQNTVLHFSLLKIEILWTKHIVFIFYFYFVFTDPHAGIVVFVFLCLSIRPDVFMKKGIPIYLNWI